MPFPTEKLPDVKTAALPPPGSSLSNQDIKRAYRRYAPVYDLVFGSFFNPGQKLALRLLLEESPRRVLEIGIGTGLLLPHYPAGLSVTGVDLSPEMLARAAARPCAADLSLLEMDAAKLGFPDAGFDAVLGLYVASVVPDPADMLSEALRVLRPGGRLILVNHFSRPGHWSAGVEALLAPLSRRLGWRPHFQLQDLLDLLPVRPERVERCGLFGYWTLISLRRPAGPGPR